MADSLYIILGGRVKVYSANAAGREVTIITHGPGEYVDNSAPMSDPQGSTYRNKFGVRTTGATSVVTGANLRQFVAAHPDFAMHLIQKLIWRVRQATDSVKSLALQDVYGRVVRLMHELSVPQGVVRVVAERLTQQDIAERVGSSREMVSRIFKDLSTGGYVVVVSGRITIVKPPPAAW